MHSECFCRIDPEAIGRYACYDDYGTAYARRVSGCDFFGRSRETKV